MAEVGWEHAEHRWYWYHYVGAVNFSICNVVFCVIADIE